MQVEGSNPGLAADPATGSRHALGSTGRRPVGAANWRSLIETTRKVGQVIRGRVSLRRCTHVGQLPRVLGKPRIYNHGTILLGDRIRIHSTIVQVELAALNGGTIKIGDGTFLNYGVSISAFQLVEIGRSCLLGTYVNILDNNWHDIEDRKKVPPSRPVALGDNVWLGNRVIVLPGVTIGHDSVIGAGSVVVKDIPPRSVAAGNPARVIRSF